MRPKPPNVLKDFSLQAAGSYVSSAMLVVRGLVLAAILGPGALGTYSLVGIVLGYSAYADVGVSLAACREIPVATGRGSAEDARRAQWCAWVAKAVAATVVATGVAAYAVLRKDSLDPDVQYGLLVASLAIVPLGLVTVAQSALPAWMRYGRNFILSAALAGTFTLAVLLGAASWGIQGALAGQAATFCMIAVLGVWLVPRALPGRLGSRYLLGMVVVGAPLAALNFLGYSLVYVDQVMVGSLLGRESMGIYALVLAAGGALYIVPSAVAQAVGPRLLRRFGEYHSVESIRRLTWLPVEALSVTMPIIAAIVWVAAPPLITWLLPRYVDAVAPLRVYAVAVCFLGINLGVSTTLIAMKKHVYNLPILVGVVALNVLVDLLLVTRFDLGLTGIALGSVITYFTYWLAHTTLVRHFFGQSVVPALAANLTSAWTVGVLALWALVASATGHLSESAPAFEALLVITVVACCAARWLTLRGDDLSREDGTRAS
jgi:O-antigen/teichoic acid export membrane protein